MNNHSNSIYTSYKENLYETETQEYPLEDILKIIRSGHYADIIDRIRSSSEEESHELKKNLPMFFPCIKLSPYSKFESNLTVSSRGIVHFDIDDYSDIGRNKEILCSLNRLPQTIYSFLSPRGGIKFAVRTDYCCEDKSIIKDTFKIAFGLVIDHLKEMDFCLDIDKTSSLITQGCFFSSDDSAYFNADAISLEINERVYKIFEDQTIKRNEEERNFIVNHSFSKPEDEEVLDALSYIPKDLKYNNNRQGNGRRGRLEINGAVLSHFGLRGVEILISHWNKRDKNRLRNQIEGQFNLNQFTVGTLFKEAKNYGWERKTTGINADVKETNEKGTYQIERTNLDEANQELSDVIGNFFQNKQNTIVLCEAGAGKTAKVIDEIAKFNQGLNLGRSIAIFVKTYALADEIEENLCKKLNWKKAGEKDDFLLTYKVHKIQGIDRLCREYDKETISLVGTGLCKNCKYGFQHGDAQAPQCLYLRQYDHKMIFMNRIRIYTHNHLFNPSQFDDINGFKPDYLIIDEDIVEAMIDVENNTISFSKNELPRNLRFLHDLVVEGKEIDISPEILKDFEFQIKAKKLESENMKPDDLSFKDLHKEIRNLKKQHEFLIRLTERETKKFPSNSRDTIKICAGQRGKIHERWAEIPILYLDASGNEDILRYCFGKNFSIRKIRINFANNVKITQVCDKSFSKSQLKGEGRKKGKDEEFLKIKTLLDSLPGRTGVITYQEFEERFFEMGVEKKNILHFGNLRGLDRFSDYDNLVIIGRYRIPSDVMQDKAILMWDSVKSKNEFLFDKDNINPYFEYRPKVIEKKGGPNVKVFNEVYLDKGLRLISEHIEQAELYQAVHRLRLVHPSDRKKTVYLLTNTVTENVVDEVVSVRDLFPRIESVKNLEIIKRAIQKNKFIQFKDNEIAKITGMKTYKIRNLRKNHLSWFENNFLLIKAKVTTSSKNSNIREYLVSKDYNGDFYSDILSHEDIVKAIPAI